MKGYRYQYDRHDQLVGMSDARGCGADYRYDRAGRLVSVDLFPCDAPGTAQTMPAYSAPSPATGAPSSGVEVHFEYDQRGRPVEVATTDGPGGAAFWTTQHYGAGGSLMRVTTSHDPAPAADHALVELGCRTADGLVTRVSYGDGADTQTVTRHDARRRAATITTFRSPGPTFPPGETGALLLEDSTFEYDAASNPVCIADGRDPAEWPPGARPATRRFGYDAFHRVVAATTEHHLTTPLAPSEAADGWVSPDAPEEAAWVAPPAIPELDAARALPSPRVVFDARPRAESWSFDYLGNLTSSTDDQGGFYDRSLGAQTHQAAAPYRLDQASLATGTRGGALQASYDLAGNLTTLVVRRNGPCSRPTGCSHVFRYEWDELSRLTRARRWDFTSLPDVTSPPATPDAAAAADLRHRYDADDRRTVKTAKVPPDGPRHTLHVFPELEYRRTTFTTDHVHEATNRVPTFTANGVRLARVLHDPTLPESSSTATRTFLSLPDHLGSTSTVLDQLTGELVENSTWSPFGARATDLRPARWNHFREDHGFTGKEEDVEVGLVYFGKRFYSPQLARWMSPDPLALHDAGQGDLNLYAYVRGMVLKVIDPLGLDGVDYLELLDERPTAWLGAAGLMWQARQEVAASGLSTKMLDHAYVGAMHKVDRDSSDRSTPEGTYVRTTRALSMQKSWWSELSSLRAGTGEGKAGVSVLFHEAAHAYSHKTGLSGAFDFTLEDGRHSSALPLYQRAHVVQEAVADYAEHRASAYWSAYDALVNARDAGNLSSKLTGIRQAYNEAMTVKGGFGYTGDGAQVSEGSELPQWARDKVNNEFLGGTVKDNFDDVAAFHQFVSASGEKR